MMTMLYKFQWRYKYHGRQLAPERENMTPAPVDIYALVQGMAKRDKSINYVSYQVLVSVGGWRNHVLEAMRNKPVWKGATVKLEPLPRAGKKFQFPFTDPQHNASLLSLRAGMVLEGPDGMVICCWGTIRAPDHPKKSGGKKLRFRLTITDFSEDPRLFPATLAVETTP